MNLNRIEIYEPRWHDRVVLIAKHRVQHSNLIYFSKTKAYEGKEFYMLGEDIAMYPLGNNGKIACYEVPLGVLENCEV